MAGSGRRIVIEFLGRDSGFGDAADDAARKSSKLSDTLKTVGKVGALALAAGAAVAGKALWDMTKAAIEDQKSQATLAQALRNTADATDAQVAAAEDWISAQGAALGVTDDELRPALERLSRATGDVTEAQKLASIAMDVSAGTGKSLQAVSEALGRAADGNTSALSRLGIKTKDAEGNTLSFQEVTQKLADTFQGQARTSAETLEGRMTRLRVQFDEAREAIGERLIPVVSNMVDWFLKRGLPAIQDIGGWMRDNLGPIVGAVADAVRRMTKRFGDATKAGGELDGTMNDLEPTLRLIRGIMESELGRAIGKLANVSVPYMTTQFRVFTKTLGIAGKAAIALYNSYFAPMTRLIITAISRLMDMWGAMLRTLGKVPGFGWAGEAGRKMQGAADKARNIADNIRAIPPYKRVDVDIVANVRRIAEDKFNEINPFAGRATPRAVGGAGGSLVPRSTLAPRMAMAGGGAVTVNFNAPIDSVSAGREVRRVLNAYERTMGGRQVVM